ncbi:MAG: hypothetical protein ACUVT7_07535 [Thermoplasmata archaeon]
MKALSRYARVTIVLAAVVVLALFSGISLLKLSAMAVGTAMVFLGIAYYYRAAAAIGLLILSATAAASVQVSTLLEVDELLTAAIGLLTPVSILAGVALTVEEERLVEEAVGKRPIAIASIYGLACLFSVPIAVLIISAIHPGVSTRTETMAEAAIVLMTATIGGVLITVKGPGPPAAPAASEKMERGE